MIRMGLLLYYIAIFTWLTSTSEAFLDEQLPLKIDSTTIGETSASGVAAVEVEGSQSITVVFSRPVIALGSDFAQEVIPRNQTPFFFLPESQKLPGSFRWVTTYIARWDPEGEWAPGLDITLVWNEELTTWDGVGLDLTDRPQQVQLKTPDQDFKIVDVFSEVAKNLTDGEWAPYTTFSKQTPEVPPDGILEIHFKYPINLSMVQQSFTVLEANQTSDIETQVYPCKTQAPHLPTDVKCVHLELKGELDIGKRYSLMLPAGTTYHPLSGPLRQDLSTDFTGLVEFQVSFYTDRKMAESLEDTAYNGFTYRRFYIWLRHGLAESVTLDDLKDVITLEKVPFDTDIDIDLDTSGMSMSQIIRLNNGLPRLPETETVDFNLTLINKGILQLSAMVQPSSRYRIRMAGSDRVSDGYGLPLLDALYLSSEGVSSSYMYFNMKQLGEVSQTLSPKRPVFEDSEGVEYRWPYLSRAKDVRKVDKVSIWKVTEGNLMSVLMTRFIYGPRHDFRNDLNNYTTSPDNVIPTNEDPLTLNLIDTDVDALLSQTGAVVLQECCPNTFDNVRYSDASYGLFEVFKRNQQHVYVNKGNVSYVFVTDTATGTPVQNVSVGLYFLRTEMGLDPELVAEGETDREGVAVLDLERFMGWYAGLESKWNYKFVLVMRSREGKIYFEEVEAPEIVKVAKKVVMSTVLDRKLVRPGESLIVKGYVREFIGKKVGIPDEGQVVAKLKWEQTEGDAIEESIVGTYEQQFGSFVVEIPVPEQLKLKEYRAEIQFNKDYRVYEAFTVADPRPPTATLDIQVPSFTRPDSVVEIKVQATSLIGASVQTEMTLTWSMGDIKGNETISTNAQGQGTSSIDLFEIGNFSTGSSLEINVEWIGPTRERISQKASVPVRFSERKVSLALSLSTDIPGIPFEIQTSVTGPNSNETEIFIYLVNVTGTDLESESRLDVDFSGTEYGLSEEDLFMTVQNGDYGVGMGREYALPDIGQYLIAACFEEEDDLVCRGKYIGKTTQQWNETPLKYHTSIYTDIAYTNGEDNATLLIDIPYENSEAFVVWGNTLETRTARFGLVQGMQQVRIPIGDECIGTCGVDIGINVPRQSLDTVQPVQVPTSKLFDPTGPHVFTSSKTVTKTVKSSNLRVELEVQDEVVEPGENTSIDVRVFECERDGLDCSLPPSNEVEVTLIGVDKSILQAVPYSPVLANFAFNLLLKARTAQGSSFIPASAVDAMVDFIRELDLADPFVPLRTSVLPRGGSVKDYIDGTIEEYLAGYNNDLTVFGDEKYVGFESVIQPMMLMFEGGGGSSRAIGGIIGVQEQQAPSVVVRVEDDFVTTPLFTVFKAQRDGSGQATFTAPPNIGTFVIRAYATNTDYQVGQAETELIVRRAVSLTATIPRNVRVGDEFKAGAVVTLTGSETSEIEIKATLSIDNETSAITVPTDTALTQSIQTGVDGTVEVLYPFSAVDMGEATFTINVEISDGKTDALQVSIPVEGTQDPVVVASSFAVQASGDWVEGIQLPNALPGSGSVNLIAGVGRLPAIESVASMLIANKQYIVTPQAHYALSALIVKPILDTYGIKEGELYVNASQLFEESLTNLTIGQLTYDSDIGLTRYVYDDESNVPDNADIYLNAYGAFIGQEVLQLQGVTQSQRRQLSELVSTWKSVAFKQAMVDSTLEGKNLSLTETALVLLIHAQGGVRTGTALDVARNFSIERLVQNVESLSDEGVAYLCLLLSKDYQEYSSTIVDILQQQYIANLRVGGRTAYIAYDPLSATPVPAFEQAMALLAFVRAQSNNPLVEKLANYLGGPLNGNGIASSQLPYSTSGAIMLALANFDRYKNSTTPNLLVNVRSGDVQLLTGGFNELSNLPIETSTPWAALDSPPNPIVILASGEGEVTIATILNFAPRELIQFPVYRGFHVASIIQMTDPIEQSPVGPALSKVPLGSVVSITIQVVSPDAYAESRVRVLMPGGLEPIDPNVDPDVEGQGCSLPWARGLGGLGSSWYLSWWCPEQETRPEVVTFDVQSIGPGAVEFNVLAIAATRGKFVLPSVKAYVLDEPEILGLSAAGYFEICENCEPGMIEEPDQIAKGCTNDCSGLGFCNLDQGTCTCNSGFYGEDCSNFVEE
eukprot:TRINITY_DN254_c1_g1_i7.p1 TRINITY_DN254_c1_g1~~TRINITY_DN254_c1_g1_i7.p1  ORF type:complete len:2168 (+),score=332.40 TRINITY_DN254_c1_g1_i7:163-6504(+)